MTTAVAPVRIGARQSPLARAQADQVAALLAAAGIASTFVGITTQGDTDRRRVTEIGGTGIWAAAVREELLNGQIDVAVHSLKDLPTEPVPGLRIAAIPSREDTRDVLIGVRLADLRDGIRIGTGAPRRALQLRDFARSHGLRLEVVPVRGNVGTRLDLVRSGQVDAVVLAAAGLIRLGELASRDAGDADVATEVAGMPAEVLSFEVMLPAPGQGALGLEISTNLRSAVQASIVALDDQVARAESVAERSFLATLEAGCTAPVGARAIVKSVRGTTLDLTLAAVIGRTLGSNRSDPSSDTAPIRVFRHLTEADPEQLGHDLAGQVLEQLRTDN